MRFVVAGLAVALVGLSACGSTAETTTSTTTTTTTTLPPVPTISGSLAHSDFQMDATWQSAGTSIIRNGDGCVTKSSEWPGAGSRILIIDDQGNPLGTGSVGQGGVITGLREDWDISERPTGAPVYPANANCAFPFAVELTAGADLYGIFVDDESPLAYSHQELESLGWDVALTFG